MREVDIVHNIFIVAFSYAAALVGAGFASGQEIISFFVKYGKMSCLGILAAALLFGFFGAIILCGCIKSGTVCYSEYLEGMTPKPTKHIMEFTTLIYGLAVFCVMASCCGEMGYALFGWDIKWGVLILCVLCALIFIMGTDGAMDLNAVLGAVIVIGIISCCFYILTYREHQAFSNNIKIATSSMSYSGYNLLTAGCILAPLSKRLKSTSEAWLAGLVSTCAMFAMMILMWWVLSIYYGKINLGEIPMLTMAMRQNKVIAVIYSALLFAAVLSTAVSNGVSCINIFAGAFGRPAAGALVVACGLCFGKAGFSSLINTVYRICGYAGIFIVVYLLIKSLKKLKNKENYSK